MLGKKKLLNLINHVLDKSIADQTEIVIINYTSYLTRYANNYIHQNVGEENTQLVIRTVIGKRIGLAGTNSLSKDRIEEALQNAIAITKLQPENPDFRTLPFARKNDYQKVTSFFKPTAAITSAYRAQKVKPIFELARSAGLNAYGSFTTGTTEMAVGNSLGILAYNQASDAYCNVVVMGDNSSGYAEAASRDVRDIDTTKLAKIAIKKALDSKDPVDLPAGRYSVILEPLAVAELLIFLNWLGFGAKVYQEGRSFLKGKLGTKIVDDHITLLDDAFDKRGFAFPFDFEGMPKTRLKLIDKGIARDLAYDSITAFKESKESTGHAIFPGGYSGPFALNLILKGGKTTLKEMIKTTKKGILVTRFHYTNVVEPMKTIITGMTRDGTFLVENGEIIKGIKNLRFTQSLVEAFSNLVELSKKLTLAGGGAGYGARFAIGQLVPALKINDFNFTGVTEF